MCDKGMKMDDLRRTGVAASKPGQPDMAQTPKKTDGAPVSVSDFLGTELGFGLDDEDEPELSREWATVSTGSRMRRRLPGCE
jgi:hypothetical protein